MAGLLDRVNRVGSKARGTRSQFRLNSENIFPFKCAYPIRLTDIMDSNQVSQNGEVLPANRGAVRTRTIREYEQTIKDLKKENFDLKLRLFMLEESCKKVSNKEDAPEADDSVSVMVELKFEVEALRNDLSEKENLLQTALEQVQQYETELKDLQAKQFQSQGQIALLTELPSMDQYLTMKNEKEKLEKEIGELKHSHDEKSNELQLVRKEMEELSSKNMHLESKVKKSSQTIQGLVYKFKQETEILPKDVRSIIIHCLEAAKAGNEQALISSLQEFRTVLSQMSSDSLSNAFELCYATNGTKDQHVKSLEEMLAKFQKKCKNLEKQIEALKNKSLDQSKVIEENEELKSELKNNMNLISELEQKIIQLKGELHNVIKKAKMAEDVSRDEKSHLSKDDLMISNSLTQTELTQHSLMESKLSYSEENFVHSDDINELKEEICILKLSIDQKDKELSCVKDKLSHLQVQLDEALHQKEVSTHVASDYNEEMANLHQQLTHSCLVNKELVKHLERLAIFMENLLQQKHDTSSMENLTESTDFFSELSKCIDKSLQLSQNLTKHLSICEASRIFDAEDSSISIQKDDGQISYGDLELSKLNFASQTTSCEDIEGRNFFEQNGHESSNVKTGKRRRWSYNIHHEALQNNSQVESDNIVVLGTSGNEELILLLNENGVPEDVFIRNNNYPNLGREMTLKSYSNKYPYEGHNWNDYTINGKNEKIPSTRNGFHKRNKISGIIHRNAYFSSDSDIWSEPDKDISLQRIGIDVKTSPVCLKSPSRKQRSNKDKKSLDEQSSEKNATNYSYTKNSSWLRRRRNSGSTPKRLFVRESTRKADYRFDKVYYLLKDKYSEISMILDDLEKIDAEKSEHIKEIFVNLNNIKILLNDTVQDLKCINEKSKELQPLSCERCIIIEFCFQLEKSLQTLKAYLSHDIDQTHVEQILKNSLSAINDLKNKLNNSFEHLFPNTGLINQYLTDIQDNYYQEFKEIKDMNEHLQNEIINLKDILKNKETSIESLKKQRNDLHNEIDNIKKRLDIEIEKKRTLSADKDSSMQKISQLNEDKVILNETIKNLELRSEQIDMDCNKLKDELKETKEKLEKMTEKCIKYEAENENLSKINKDNLDLKNKINNLELQASQTNVLCDQLKIKLKEKDEELEKLGTKYRDNEANFERLSKLNEENLDMKKSIKILESEASKTNILCEQLKNELKETKEKLEKMTEQCIKYEAENENLSKINKDNFDLKNKIKNLELQASQTNVLCDQLKIKLEEKKEKLEKLGAKCLDYEANFERLSKLNEERLDMEKNIKILESEVSKTNILCEQLKKELEIKNDELDKLHSQCVQYETQMNNLSQINAVKTSSSLEEIIAKSNQYKHEIDALLKAKNTLTEKREKEKIKFSQEKETLLKHNEDLLFEKNTLLHQINLEKSKAKNLENENNQLNDKLIQSSHVISELQEELDQLGHVKILIENEKDKFMNLYNDLIREMNYTKEKLYALENICAEYESKLQSGSEIQKNLTHQIKSLSEANSALQKQIKENILEAEMKKNEIIRLNEKRFNMEMQYNLLEDKEEIPINVAFDIPDDQCESVASTFQNRSLDSIKTNYFGFGKLALDASLNKTNRDIIENQAKQIKSFETKLSIYESRLKFLEKDNQDLRDQLTLHLSNKNKIFNDTEDNSALLNKIANLESQIKSKESFIDCLKNDLSKTSNELINKNKEIEELIKQLEHYKNIFDKCSPESFLEILSYSQENGSPYKSNIKIMNDRKWDLIQRIFDIQKKIYSEKGLPLDKLENFHKRIIMLYSLQTSKDLNKWHSEPFLKSASLSNTAQVIKQVDINERDYIINLKIDIDFLEHLLLFIRCFCLPSHFEPSESYEHGSDSDNNYLAKYICKQHLKFDDRDKTSILAEINGTTEIQRKGSEDNVLPIIKNKWDEIIKNMSLKLTYIENIFKSMNLISASDFLRSIDYEGLGKNPSAQSQFLKIIEDVISLLEKMENVFHMNSTLKFCMESPLFAYKFDISDRESVLSDETLALSRSESLSPVNLDDALLPSLPTLSQRGNYLNSLFKKTKDNHLYSTLHSPPSKLEKSAEVIGSSADSVCQRSHYSSPDLGIESDPNHESSAPELVEKDFILKDRRVSGCSTSGKEEKSILFESDLSKARKLSDQFLGTCDTLRAISSLEDYELLKKELGEILIGIKSILTRADNALHNIVKCVSSSRKSLEYSTLKEIKHTSTAIEFYLNEAVRIVDNFIIESCPTVEEWKLLLQQNEELNEKLSIIQTNMRLREKEFNEATEKLKQTQLSKENMEKKISKKLLKTKKVIKQAEQHLLQMQTNKCMPKSSS